MDVLIPLGGICIVALLVFLPIYIALKLRRDRKITAGAAAAGIVWIAAVATVCASAFLLTSGRPQFAGVAATEPTQVRFEQMAPTRPSDVQGGAPAPAPLNTQAAEPPLPTQVLNPAPPLPQPTPAQAVSLAERIQNELARLESGRILYNPPEQMNVLEKQRVEVRITFDETGELAKGLEGSGAPRVEEIKVANFMKVDLIGDAFDITPLSSDEQLVVPNDITEWAWDVVPKRGGDHSLTIRVTARVKLEGFPDEQKDLEIIERKVNIQVSPLYTASSFVDSNKEWLIPSVAIPLLIAICGWGWRRYVRRPDGTTHANPPPPDTKEG